MGFDYNWPSVVLCIMPHLKHDTSIANSVKTATK